MGDLFRSEDMALCQIFIPVEAAYFTVLELGEIGMVQFKDLNEGVQLLQRNYAKDVLRCYDMERKLKIMANEVKEHQLDVFMNPQGEKAQLTPNEITSLQNQIKSTEKEIERLNKNSDGLKTYAIQLQEFKYVLQNTEEFLKERDAVFGFDSSFRTEQDFQTALGMDNLNVFTGAIAKERAATFEKLVWRISAGCAFFKREDIREPVIDSKGTKHYKTVFIICCHGEQLTVKVRKLCNGYRASLYTCPSVESERQNVIDDINERLADMELIINQTDAIRRKFLISVAHQWDSWSIMVKKIKAVYHTLNYCNLDVTGKCLIGECWVPVKDIPRIKQALADGSKSFCSVSPFLYILETDETPPTYIRTDKYTHAFQNLINVYGTATYKEANPAMYLIVTFPFLFAVMFGDTGHGLVMTIFAAYLIVLERTLPATARSEIFMIFYSGRYMILLMGLFSMYTGLIYNDHFSKHAKIFKSSWFTDFTKAMVVNNTEIGLHPKLHYKGVPYEVGVDPAWGIAHNEIQFLNSYKMKVSIIIGVFHMILGLSISIVNYRYFGETFHIYIEFIPRLLLLCCLFLWLVIMMFIKWSMYSANNSDVQHGTSCAPSILVCFIDMMLFKKSAPPYPECNTYLFQHQPTVQLVLVLIAAASIPVMLFGVPLHACCHKKKHSSSKESKLKPTKIDDKNMEDANVGDKDVENMTENEGNKINNTASLSGPAFPVKSEENDIIVLLKENYSKNSLHSFTTSEEFVKDEKQESMSEMLVLQVIETIEYALGVVSHTASYLRLWALSLAHNELSAVLWERLLCIGLNPEGYTGGIIMFLIFFIWMIFTVLILIVMEGLSAFLHTLRLHWVEFMSKFYMGRGLPFLPLCFKTILEKQDVDS